MGVGERASILLHATWTARSRGRDLFHYQASCCKVCAMDGSVLLRVYEDLLSAYGPQGWWPVTPEGGVEPVYSGGPENRPQRFEVAVGAVLTQNTTWMNASRAIENLNRSGLMSPGAICAASLPELAETIRPAGYYNQKAERLVRLASYLASEDRPNREALLALNGVGPETADSIMLYAYGEPYFVIDAYTRRIFCRVGLIEGSEPYDDIRLLFERALPRDSGLYQEYHALIVEHAKRHCRSREPLCHGCAIAQRCCHHESAG